MSEISQGGVVESDGRLSLGDQILSINGDDIRAVTQDYAHTLLQVLHSHTIIFVQDNQQTNIYLFYYIYNPKATSLMCVCGFQNCSGSVVLEVARFRATPPYPYECQVKNGM